ncbi:MAG: IS66 family transposase [Burkholderiales bacterium]
MLSIEQQLADSQTQNALLRQQVALLEEQVSWLKRRMFGRSSEKTPASEVSPEQGRLFNEAEVLATLAATETLTIPAHERKKAGRKRLAADLPRVDVIHDLPEAQKVCAADGRALERIGEETSEQLDYQPAKVRVIRHVRPKYACPGCRQGVKIAPVPPQLLPKAQASASLLAHLVTAKYVDGLPLYRQEAQFVRLGLTLGRATMAGWMIKLGGTHVVPLINLLNEQLIAAPLIHCDETRLQVLKSPKAPSSDHWMWVRAAGPPGRRIVLFDYDPSRGARVPERLLADFKGILLTDGYEPYNAVANAHGLVHAGCWAHARRYFEEARKAHPDPAGNARAGIAIDTIGKLYRVERAIKELPPAEKLTSRARHSAPILTELRAWLEGSAGAVLPQSALGKAVNYALGQWPKLTRFVEYGEIPLDNNRCENAIRPFVIGRKGWLFADTQAGATASANLYSLVETAKANGLEPHAYLTRLFAELPFATGIAHFEALLPWNVKDAVPSLDSHPHEQRKNAVR